MADQFDEIEKRLGVLERFVQRQRELTCPLCEGYPQAHRPCSYCRGTGRRIYTPIQSQTGDYWLDHERPYTLKGRWARLISALGWGR